MVHGTRTLHVLLAGRHWTGRLVSQSRRATQGERAGGNAFMALKYYFNPKGKTDRFNFGIYTRPGVVTYEEELGYDFRNKYTVTTIPLGFLAGYK